MGLWEQFLAWLHPPAIKQITIWHPPYTQANQKAFLTMIAVSEGTEKLGNNGYNVLFGGELFTNYADHPRKEVFIPRLGIETSAAGRYQIEKGTFDFYKKKLDLVDFSPKSQDTIALALIADHCALDDVNCGRVEKAVAKCSSVWASFQGSKAGQPTNSVGVLIASFKSAGGKLA